MNWVAVLEDKKLKEDTMKIVFPKGISILLIRKKENEIYAISNKCAHMACPMMGGSLDGYILQCPCHDWKFDIRTGVFVDAPEIKVPIYEWHIDKGSICIKME